MTSSIAAGQTWRPIDGSDDIRIIGRATSCDGWAVTSPTTSTPYILTVDAITTGYRLVKEYQRPDAR